MFSGCIVEDPPPYTQPTQTPPRLDLRLAEPPPSQIIIVDQSDPITFRVPFASEDAADKVRGFIFLDYSERSKTPLASVTVEGSTLDDRSRSIELTYPATDVIEFGCHRIMIRISHELNFERFPPGEAIDQGDVAEAYWWINVIDLAAGDDGSVLRNCSATTVVPAQ
jgi:hypothetical protein